MCVLSLRRLGIERSGGAAAGSLSAKPPVDGNFRGDRGEMVFRVGALISGLQLLVHGSDS